MQSTMGKYYELNKEELLKSFSFLGLFIAGLMEYYNSGKTLINIFKDPFFIGAGVMSVASIYTFIYYNKIKIDYTYPTMFFFIFTRLISQYGYSYKYNIDGTLK